MTPPIHRRIEDPLVTEIRYELMPGRFIRWDEVSRLAHNLDRVHEKVEELVQAGEAERAVRLYEVFLSGVYSKIEEADDECYLARLFHRLACGWIQARQAAGQPAEETVSQLLNWMNVELANGWHGYIPPPEKFRWARMRPGACGPARWKPMPSRK